MAPVLKTGIPERVSGGRIPPSPPDSLDCRESARQLSRHSRFVPVFRDSDRQVGLRRTDYLDNEAHRIRLFLWSASDQSDSQPGAKRRFSDHKPNVWRSPT